MNITHNPEVIHALNPWWAVKFFIDHGWHGIFILGAVVLAVTGGEALVRGHGPLRPRADPDRLEFLRAAVADAQLPRAGRARARATRRGQEPVLRRRAGVGAVPDDRAGDDGRGHRLAGGHHRRLFGGAPGDAARLHPAHGDPPHLARNHRPDLRAVDQLGADDRGDRAGARVPDLHVAGFGLRRVRRRHDADRHPAAGAARALAVEARTRMGAAGVRWWW